ncbi:MAG: hypothetical protein ABI615_13650 [Chthoniobacterales bacterium]
MRSILIGFLTILAASALQAQQPLPPVQTQTGELVAPKKTKTQVIQEKVIVKPPPVKMDGILSQIFTSPAPIQMINPLAPKKYGSGDQNLSIDPFTGNPEGFILFGIRW